MSYNTHIKRGYFYEQSIGEKSRACDKHVAEVARKLLPYERPLWGKEAQR